MLKKNIIIILLISFALISIACSKVRTDAVNEQIIQQQAANNQNKLDAGEKLPYEIKKETYADRNININYPRISKLSNEDKQNKINEIIKTDAFHILGWYSNAELDRFSMKLDYDIKLQNAELLSIKFSGYRYLKGNAYPTDELFTTNINMHDGSRLRLKDIINIDNNLLEKIKQGKLSRKIPFETLEYTDDKLIKAFYTADLMTYQIGTKHPENIYGAYSYFTNDSLGVSINVPHAIGDHIELEIKYQEISDNIRTENNLLKEFLK